MIDPRAVAVEVDALALRGQEVLSVPRQVWQRYLRKYSQSDRVQPADRNRVAGEGNALDAGGIVDGRLTREIPGAQRGRGNRKRLRQRLPQPLPLITGEEKRLVLNNGAADARAKLI